MIALTGQAVKVISHIMHVCSGIAILAIVMITCFDVIMRRTGFTVDFPYEVIRAVAGIVIAFALPETSLSKAHVAVEYLETKVSPDWFKVTYVFTRGLGIALLLFIGSNAVLLGNHLFKANEHSAVLRIPEFLFPYFLAAGCLAACLAILYRLAHESEEKQG